jgi:hypothetical protein
MDPPPGPARSRLADDPVDGAAAAFMRAVHERFGDPATIRTDWTDEPMVLFSNRDSAIAPAGRTWESAHRSGRHGDVPALLLARTQQRRASQRPPRDPRRLVGPAARHFGLRRR